MKNKNRITRTLSLLLVLTFLVGALTTVGFAATVTLNQGATSTAFFAQPIVSYVTVDQTAATWRNVDKTIEWSLYTSAGDVVRTMVLLTGADSTNINTKAAYSGLDHRLTLSNTNSTSVAVVYTYTLN